MKQRVWRTHLLLLVFLLLGGIVLYTLMQLGLRNQLDWDELWAKRVYFWSTLIIALHLLAISVIGGVAYLLKKYHSRS